MLNVNPAHRKTPTLGRKQSFFEELFGNIGTVGAPGLPGSAAAGQPAIARALPQLRPFIA